MPVTKPPITTIVAIGDEVTIPNPLAIRPDTQWQVRVDNITAFVLQVVVAGVSYWQMPLSSTVYSVVGSGELTFIATARIGNVTSPAIYTMFAASPDTVPPGGNLNAGIVSQQVTPHTFHGARLVKTAGQNVLDGGNDIITFPASTIDTDGYVIGNTFVVPAGLAGTYLVICHCSWVNGGAIANVLEFTGYLNGAPHRDLDTIYQPTMLSAGNRQDEDISAVMQLAVGDTVRFQCFNITGAIVALDGGANDTVARFVASLTLLGS